MRATRGCWRNRENLVSIPEPCQQSWQALRTAWMWAALRNRLHSPAGDTQCDLITGRGFLSFISLSNGGLHHDSPLSPPTHNRLRRRGQRLVWLPQRVKLSVKLPERPHKRGGDERRSGGRIPRSTDTSLAGEIAESRVLRVRPEEAGGIVGEARSL